MHYWPTARAKGECGPHQIQAVLRTRDKEASIEELYFTDYHREVDWTLPWFVPAILRRHGIRSRMRFWLRRSFAKNLRKRMEAGTTVLIVINSILGRGDLHWISAWGYDAVTDEFLCYDSQAESAESPHGNTRYTGAQLTAALPGFGTFVIEIL